MNDPSNRVIVGGRRSPWAPPDQPATGGTWTADHPLAWVCATQQDAISAVRHHIATRVETLIVASARADQQMLDELGRDGFEIIGVDSRADDGTPGRLSEPDRLWIATSGSTGRPKRIAHTLASLTTVASDQPARVWLCPYSPGTYAWWQLVTLSLTQPGQDLVMVDADELDMWPTIAAHHGVTAVSGTPTFWRQSLFRSGDLLAQLPLTQVTLGGEPVDQAVLDRLRGVFPHARISWIYASSEVGAAITVHDGRAGFPVAWLDREHPGQPTLAVEDGELVVASARRGAGVEARRRTGDRVEFVDDRVLIVGRQGADEINVGGVKVSAAQVRDVLQAHEGVQWARVTGRRAPIVGQVVAAEIVTDGSIDEQGLLRWAEQRLPASAVPRNIRLFDEIPMKATLKSDV